MYDAVEDEIRSDEFDPFDRVRAPEVRYVGMMLYDGDLSIPEHYLVSPECSFSTGACFDVSGGRATY